MWLLTENLKGEFQWLFWRKNILIDWIMKNVMQLFPSSANQLLAHGLTRKIFLKRLSQVGNCLSKS